MIIILVIIITIIIIMDGIGVRIQLHTPRNAPAALSSVEVSGNRGNEKNPRTFQPSNIPGETTKSFEYGRGY